MASLLPMLHRRALLMSSAAAATVSTATVEAAPAPSPAPAKTAGPANYARDSTGERLPNLDLEGRIDYLNAHRAWLDTTLSAAAKARSDQILKDNGIAPDADVPLNKTLALLSKDPVIALTGKTYVDLYKLRFSMIRQALDRKADRYLADLDAADRRGPGTVEVNPAMDYPTYAKREIHTQPGGTVGHPLAGYLFRYVFDKGAVAGANYHDEGHQRIAASVPLPADGRVLRVLEIGCAAGQYTSMLKLRFPQAEVWGIDVGAPMVRYAHMKAADMGIDVNYAHRLAEDTRFPDGYFDIVTAFTFFHEVSGEANRQILKETQRILRPGGVFYPVDFGSHANAHKKDAMSRHQRFWAYRWFHEDWTMDYVGLDYGAAMRGAGFDVKDAPTLGGGPNFVGYKA